MESEPASFFNEVADGQIGTKNIALAQFANAPAGFLAGLAFGRLVRGCRSIRGLLKNSLQNVVGPGYVDYSMYVCLV